MASHAGEKTVKAGQLAMKAKTSIKWKALLQNTAAQQCSNGTHIFKML